ncbi:MAG: class I SAM-dependent rRNA methyltransferase [Chthoniobacterales bacterium]
MAGVVVRPRSRILHGHDWVFRSEVLKAFGNPKDGDVVSIKDGRDRMLGSGIYNGNSSISVRRFSRQRLVLDAEFFRRRIARAWAYRQERGCKPDLCRVVWSDADGLPGIILDLYGRVAVLQLLTVAMDQRRELIAAAIQSELPVSTLVERSDAAGRRAEALPESTGILFGQVPDDLLCERDGIKFHVDPQLGQKTGLYLDQMENYVRVAKFAAGLHVVDCFSNQGGFALAAARAGARSVLAIESGEEAIAALQRNIETNQLNVKTERADVFDWLQKASRRNTKTDLIVLDPPSFARDRGSVKNALRGYRDLHLRAAGLLNKGGYLATFSCSHHITRNIFKDCLRDAFFAAKVNFRIIEEYRQASDHPAVLHMPETDYLHGLMLQINPAY